MASCVGLKMDYIDIWCKPAVDEIEDFCRKLDEKIEKEVQQLKVRRKNNELECKMAQELKLNSELTQQLNELCQRGSELERVCTTFQSLSIAESDRNRLDNAKETYQIAKEITGIRFDYTAPQEIAKGFVKSERQRWLEPFELPAREAHAQLWARVAAASAPAWPRVDKENRPHNK